MTSTKRSQHIANHTRAAIAARLAQGPKASYLKDVIYGGIDGAVTTFAVVSSVVGAGLPQSIIIIMGVANLLADGFSMAASNFLGSRAENQMREKTRRNEREHIELYPAGEKEEIREIFRRKGFDGEQLESVVETLTSNQERWIDIMVQEEHGLRPISSSPITSAIATFAAFTVVGTVPLLAFLVSWLTGYGTDHQFLISASFTLTAFFVVGALKSRFVNQHWLLAGAETMFVGSTAAALAYGIGYALKTAFDLG